MTCHYHLNFHYTIPSCVSAQLIDYNLCRNEICFFFEFSRSSDASRGLCEYNFSVWIPEELAARITAVSTFALGDGANQVDEKVSGIRYLKERAAFHSICQKMMNDPKLTQDLRSETSLSQLWTGEQEYL